MRDFFLTCSAQEIVIAGWIFFSAIYLGLGSINWLLTHQILPYLRIGKILDPRPLAAGQLQRELSLSALSIFIFGAGMVFPWGILQLGWANLTFSPSPLQIVIEIGVLILWNEAHFYINHRLLHTPWLRRFHLPHHRSIVTTPWATYSFHPIEAMLLGNVILLPMLVHDFSVSALISLPIISLIFNNLGHANYDFSPTSQRIFYGASRRHHLHHACFNGNYGFVLPYLDRWLNTALAADAANAQLSKWQERQH